MLIEKWKLILIFTTYFTLMGFFGNGCSGNSNTPVNPAEFPENDSFSSLDFDLPIAFSDTLSNGGHTGTGTLGLFNVIVNPHDLEAELTPLRSSTAIKDSFIVDISNFLTISPCTDCLSINTIILNTDGNIVINFGLEHPFEAGTLANPPSSTNRLDLHVFDVFGVLYFKGTGNTYPLIAKTLAPSRLVNADGYTDMFDSRIDPFFPTTANLHPYRVMSYNPTNGNYNPSSPSGFNNILSPTGQNILAMGGNPQYTDFVLDLADVSDNSFLLAITVAYGQSAVKSTRLYPEYYLPEFHRKEAWKVEVGIIANTLYNLRTDTYCDLEIKVWDWNHGANVDPYLTQKDSIKSESDVATVAVLIPDVTLTPVVVTVPDSGDGQSTPLIFTVHAENTGAAPSGLRTGLIKVTDSRWPGGNTGGAGDGVDRDGVTFFQLNEFATYQVFDIEVHSPKPVAVIDPTPDPPVIYPNESVVFSGANSYDYEGGISTYMWDFDYDGVNFIPTWVGATTSPITFDNNHNFDNKETIVALRVQDFDLPFPNFGIGTETVTIHPNRSPVADFVITTTGPFRRGDSVSFNAGTSSDPDGDSLTYEWDFDYTAGNFVVEATGPTSSHIFTNMGEYQVAIRVSDEGVPSPRQNIYYETILILPKFDPSQEIDATMSWREFPHDTNSTVIVSDPNTDDVYVGYMGYYGGEKIRIHRSSDGGQTWSGPTIPNNSPDATGDWGLALCVVPDSIPGKLYVFWISEGGNSSSHIWDSNNIRFNYGTPGAGNSMNWGQLAWNQDITLFNLSTAAKYGAEYHQVSDPTDMCVLPDPISIGTVYLAYVEEGASAERSVRLIKTTNIGGYPNSDWVPVSATSHVDSTPSSSNFDQVDLAIDIYHNLYVTWDDNANGQIEIRKYPYGSYPGNAAQAVDSDIDYTHLFSPRVALSKNGNPYVVYCDTYFPGGTSGISDIVLCSGTGSTPTMGTPELVNIGASQSANQYSPEIVTDRETDLIFILYEDRRDNSSNGEIYWNIYHGTLGRLLDDELVNTSTLLVNDFDVHAILSGTGKNGTLVGTWEEVAEDTFVGIAY
ncbi:PKD domain-containing protein [bacterium]|nr:PKD domain-containing protein [bacterium]MBU1024461.1 PKD domain-containing protein [bacterium]